MNQLMRKIGIGGIGTLLFVLPGWAANSFVNPDGIEKMKSAGIDGKVIEVLAAEQTCSVSPAFLIALKQAGATADTLKQIVLADRYRNPKSSPLSEKEIQLLRDIGCPEGLIARLLGLPQEKPVKGKDDTGNVIYRTDTLGASPNADCVNPPDAFYINLENVEVD